MIFPTIKVNDICVNLSDITITKVQYCRYLGIFFDDTLTWSHHIDTVYGKLMKYVGIKKQVTIVYDKTYLLCICVSTYSVRH